MLGWLAKRNENVRVYLCVKEVKWDLEKADGPRRAMLLLMAQWFRVGMTDKDKGGLEPSYFDRPLDHSRADLVELYTGLENIRNNNTYQREQIQKSLARIGGMPAYSVEQSKNTNRGLEIWMCTLGAGIAPDTRDDVWKIWTMLSEGLPYAPEAMRRLQEIVKLTENATGSKTSGMFEDLPIPQWLAAADFVPSAFRS
jgi:hypothetical protein